MNLEGILFFVARAARFSLIVCAVYAPVRLIALKAKRMDFVPKREMIRLLLVAYLAALAEIIALRGGPGDTRELHLLPLQTTFRTMKEGLWPFVYNFVGNVVWFVPLGMFAHRKGPLRATLIGAGFSLSLEALQWMLRTGVTDVDDVIVNALGALAGAVLAMLIGRMRTGRDK